MPISKESQQTETSIEVGPKWVTFTGDQYDYYRRWCNA